MSTTIGLAIFYVMAKILSRIPTITILFLLLVIEVKVVTSILQNNSSDIQQSIGAIMDITSRAGKEARVAMEIAIHDFNTKMKKNLTLFTRNSNGNLVHAIREGNYQFILICYNGSNNHFSD